MAQTILIIHTGGTIAMAENKKTGTVTQSSANPLRDTTEQFGDLNFIILEPFQLPSPHITLTEMLTLKQLIETELTKKSIHGIVITHGTDTLEETAYFLDLTVDTEIPIIITGAMRSSNELGADGPVNFINAIRVAADPSSSGKGVLVVMNDEIHAAKNVTKTHTSNVSTFQSPQYGAIGTITKRVIHFHHQPIEQEKFKITHVDKNVMLLKAYAGMDSALFLSLAEMKIDGLVIETLGQGNLPPDTLTGITKLLNDEVPIVIVSRCFNGIVEDIYSYEGGGYDLKNRGLIFSNGLNGQKARIKLLVALVHGENKAYLQSVFMR